MPQPQKNINVGAPGFLGLNTQASPIGMDISYAALADNCVIDELGRVSSRKGFQAVTLLPEAVGNMDDNPIETVYEYVERDGTRTLLLAGYDDSNAETIWSQDEDGNLTDLGSPTATANNWMFTSLSDECFFTQSAHDVHYYDGSTLAPMTQQPSAATNGLTDPDIIISGFGHLFVAGGVGDLERVQWSMLTAAGTSMATNATAWTGTATGSIDVSEYWPNGSDEIVSLAVHNGQLVIFGKRSILLYTVPTDPNGAGVGPVNMYLQDTIDNIGCIARDSVVSTGTDLLFLSASGFRSLNRTIQEKSVPLGDRSANVRDELAAAVKASNLPIRAAYSDEDAFVTLFLPHTTDSLCRTYVFDTRGALENGAWRSTKWLGEGLRCAVRTDAGDFLLGRTGGLYKYTGGDDTSIHSGESTPRGVVMDYKTHPQTFGQPAHVKFPKELDFTMIGGANATVTVSWSYDYTDKVSTAVVGRVGELGGVYGVGEYGTATYGEAGGLVSDEKVKLWGSGRNVAFGFTGVILETPVSIQELNIQAQLGRLL